MTILLNKHAEIKGKVGTKNASVFPVYETSCSLGDIFSKCEETRSISEIPSTICSYELKVFEKLKNQNEQQKGKTLTTLITAIMIL